jgi:3'(2'), 5'-bisphosphate nucleotidase
MNIYLDAMIAAGLQACKVIMDIYTSGFVIEHKLDTSPVTNADIQADKLIRRVLKEVFPHIGFLTEESTDDFSRLHMKDVWLVDPIDGTKDFIEKNGEFTVNIALVHDHQVVAGVIFAPALNTYYYAAKGQGAYVVRGSDTSRIHVNSKTEDLTALTSRFHFHEKEKQVIEKHHDKIKHIQTVGSALKACHIAEGLAEISYRLTAGTKEWDTAASDILITEAGGYFLKPTKEKYHYNRQDVRNLDGYLIVNHMDNFLL